MPNRPALPEGGRSPGPSDRLTLMSAVCKSVDNLESVEARPDVVECLHGGSECAGRQLHDLGDRLQDGFCVAVCTYKRQASLARFLGSLWAQTTLPRQVVIVDASPDDETAQAIRRDASLAGRIPCLVYVRVKGALRGLTRQRNLSLELVTTRLVAFFDDDIVLQPDCLAELTKAHSLLGDELVGVGCQIENERGKADLLWRVRRLLGIVPTLRGGAYCRSGITVPWSFVDSRADIVDGDWLQGGATMWRTDAARRVKFNEQYVGYSHGEDVEFSLRVRRLGRLVLAPRAIVDHLHEPAGRPDAYEMGYHTASNAYDIHRRLLNDRKRGDAIWFAYAFGMDAVVRSLKLPWPRGFRTRFGFLAGRFHFLLDLMLGRLRSRNGASSNG